MQGEYVIVLFIKNSSKSGDFPGGPGSIPGQGTRSYVAAWHSQKKKSKMGKRLDALYQGTVFIE